MPFLFSLCVALGAAGCSDFPDLEDSDTRAARAADFPDLATIESLTDSGTPSRIDPKTQAVFEARIASLRARASRLKRSVMDPNARNRLSQRPVVEEAS